jgi:hypothetical protein
MIDLSEIVFDRDFSQKFTVFRQHGAWAGGRWSITKEETIIMDGIVLHVEASELMQVPEGDRIRGVMEFVSHSEIFITSAASVAGAITSDQILWSDDRWRIFKVHSHEDYGFYEALGIRMIGD